MYTVIGRINGHGTACNGNVSRNDIAAVIGAASLQTLCTDICRSISAVIAAWETAPTAATALRSWTSGLNIDITAIDIQCL